MHGAAESTRCSVCDTITNAVWGVPPAIGGLSRAVNTVGAFMAPEIGAGAH